jgi:choice-of-anchor C domain-containing protein
MRRRSILGVAAAVVASLALAGSALAAFANVTNGSFETGTHTGAPFDTLNAGSTNLTGWTITTGNIDWINSLWQAKDGSKSLDMSGTAPGAISQTFATTIGNSYVVSFALSGNPAGAPAVKTLIVSATGGATTTYTFDTGVAGSTLADMKWVAKTYSFLATSASTVLTFTSATAGFYGPALDNVVVTETVAGVAGARCKNGGWRTTVDSHGNHFKNQGDCVSYFATGGRNVGSVRP